jgi:coniferyl-aldehyde dehydrogenase
VNAPLESVSQITIPHVFRSCFNRQRAAYLAATQPSHAERVADLKLLSRLLNDNRDGLVEAINADYGNRASFETLFAEYFVVLETIKDTSKNVKRWMKPQLRRIDLLTYPGARNKLIPQPLGVVGVIVPWNFPLNLSFAPLASIFAAGDRAMVKMSENSNNLAALLIRFTANYFPANKLQFFHDGGGRAPIRPLAVHRFWIDGSSSHGRCRAQFDSGYAGAWRRL